MSLGALRRMLRRHLAPAAGEARLLYLRPAASPERKLVRRLALVIALLAFVMLVLWVDRANKLARKARGRSRAAGAHRRVPARRRRAFALHDALRRRRAHRAGGLRIAERAARADEVGLRMSEVRGRLVVSEPLDAAAGAPGGASYGESYDQMYQRSLGNAQ